jgi:hypothetical protein
MRADIHGGPEQKLQSEAGYIDARPQTDSSTKTSCNARPDHTLGQKAKFRGDQRMSPFASKADISHFMSTRPNMNLQCATMTYAWGNCAP